MTALSPPVRDKPIGSLELAIRGATHGEQLAECAAVGRILATQKLRCCDLIAGADT